MSWTNNEYVFFSALLPPPKRADISGAQGKILHCGDGQRAGIFALSQHRLQVCRQTHLFFFFLCACVCLHKLICCKYYCALLRRDLKPENILLDHEVSLTFYWSLYSRHWNNLLHFILTRCARGAAPGVQTKCTTSQKFAHTPSEINIFFQSYDYWLLFVFSFYLRCYEVMKAKIKLRDEVCPNLWLVQHLNLCPTFMT